MAINQSAEPTQVESQQTRPPTDPAFYATTDHFEERTTRKGRYISEKIAYETIRHGRSKYLNERGWRFVQVVDGIKYVIIIDNVETPSPVIVTGWTEIDDKETAVRSPTWSNEQINQIGLRQALSSNDGRPVPEKIREFLVAEAINVKGHRIVTDRKSSEVRCLDCNLHTESKCELSTHNCRGFWPQ